MTRYVAFLRGVSPMNAKMPELKRCFEGAGFTNVKTLLASGNVVFDSKLRSTGAVERKAEQAMEAELDRGFFTIVRTVASLQALLASDPFAEHSVPANAKRVVSFLREERKAKTTLPLSEGDAWVLCQHGAEVFTAYVPSVRGPVFMKLIENAFGKDVTTRTWETVTKCAAA